MVFQLNNIHYRWMKSQTGRVALASAAMMSSPDQLPRSFQPICQSAGTTATHPQIQLFTWIPGTEPRDWTWVKEPAFPCLAISLAWLSVFVCIILILHLSNGRGHVKVRRQLTSQFSPPTMWIPEMELSKSGLVTSAPPTGPSHWCFVLFFCYIFFVFEFLPYFSIYNFEL